MFRTMIDRLLALRGRPVDADLRTGQSLASMSLRELADLPLPWGEDEWEDRTAITTD
jgi:hypothetical protein